MVRTDPGALSDTTVAWIDRRGNPPVRRRVRGELAAGPGPRLAAEAGRRPMFSVDLSTREWDGHVVVWSGGGLDLVDAVAAFARGRTHARRVVVPLRRPRR